MRLLLISNLYTDKKTNKLRKIIENNNYDAICLLGDISENDLNIIAENPNDTPIFGVLGDRDKLDCFKEKTISNIHLNKTTYNDISFYGIEGSIDYTNSKELAMHREEDYYEYLKKAQSSDIFLTHSGCTLFSNYIKSDLKHSDPYSPFHLINPFVEYIYKFHPEHYFFGHFYKNKDFNIGPIKCHSICGVSIFDTKTGKTKNLIDFNQ